jgi:hypothetical protein
VADAFLFSIRTETRPRGKTDPTGNEMSAQAAHFHASPPCRGGADRLREQLGAPADPSYRPEQRRDGPARRHQPAVAPVEHRRLAPRPTHGKTIRTVSAPNSWEGPAKSGEGPDLSFPARPKIVADAVLFPRLSHKEPRRAVCRGQVTGRRPAQDGSSRNTRQFPVSRPPLSGIALSAAAGTSRLRAAHNPAACATASYVDVFRQTLASGFRRRGAGSARFPAGA